MTDWENHNLQSFKQKQLKWQQLLDKSVLQHTHHVHLYDQAQFNKTWQADVWVFCFDSNYIFKYEMEIMLIES